MKDVSINFLAVEGSPHMLQRPAFCKSELHLGEFSGTGLRIIGVMVNGTPRRFLPMSPDRVSVSPLIPFECSRVVLRCLAPDGPPQAPQQPSSTYAPPPHSYGLQRPVSSNQRPTL